MAMTYFWMLSFERSMMDPGQSEKRRSQVRQR